MSLTEPPSLLLTNTPAIEAGFGSSTLLYFLVIGVLLLLSALISGSESAFFSLRPKDNMELRQENTSRSKLILNLLAKPQELLATMLITNNFVNVGVVILSTFILNDVYPVQKGQELMRFLVEVIGITLLLLLFGEVVPKIFANRNALFVVRWMSYPLYFLERTPPISWMKKALVKGTNFIQKYAKANMSVNSDELEQALALTKQHTSSEDEHKILEGIVKFGKTEASEIMTPRVEVEDIDADEAFPEVMKRILEVGYSRMPVFQESPDNIIGILYIKDLLPHLDAGPEFEWKQILRKPFFVPENKKINDLLQEFQRMKMHLAVEIVGDITDEFDDTEISFTKRDDHTFVFEGRTSLNDFLKIVGETHHDLIERAGGEAETLGGLIIEQAGRILKNNEFIMVGPFKMVVESSDKKRVKSVKVIIHA
ncbi:MAG: hypothetical protein RLZZ301_1487 [Bacteroidota bacterium]